MTYLVPFNKIKDMVNVNHDKGKLMVSASYDEFLEMVRAVLSTIEVDEEWYLATYPDVVVGIKNGKVSSARDHFMHNGYFEGRLPFPLKVDERWYHGESRGGRFRPSRQAGIRSATLRSRWL